MNFGEYFSLENCTSRSAWKIRLSVICIFFFGAFVVLFTPLEYLFEYLGYGHNNGCPLLTVTGLPCPTCGWGRSIKALTSLNFQKMFYYNPSAVVMSVLASLILLLILILSFFRKRIVMKKKSQSLWLVFVVIVILIWILNIIFGHHRS